MLGPSFSPSRTSRPGPTSSQSRPKRRPRWRASSTRRRSPERVRSSGVRSSSAVASDVKGSAERSVLTANGGGLDINGSSQAERDADPASLDPALDWPLVLACLRDFDPGPGQEPAALELAQAARVIVRNSLHDDR